MEKIDWDSQGINYSTTISGNTIPVKYFKCGYDIYIISAEDISMFDDNPKITLGNSTTPIQFTGIYDGSLRIPVFSFVL